MKVTPITIIDQNRKASAGRARLAHSQSCRPSLAIATANPLHKQKARCCGLNLGEVYIYIYIVRTYLYIYMYTCIHIYTHKYVYIYIDVCVWRILKVSDMLSGYRAVDVCIYPVDSEGGSGGRGGRGGREGEKKEGQ